MVVTLSNSGDEDILEYDALGRLISSSTQFTSDVRNYTEMLKYYYDGTNAVAEYDWADNLSRRYIHGTTYTDERAVLIEGGVTGSCGSTPRFDGGARILESLRTRRGCSSPFPRVSACAKMVLVVLNRCAM